MRAFRLESAGTVRRVVLSRPPLNVLDIAALRSLDEVVAEVEADPGACVLVLAAEGKAFCAGVDVADHTEDRVGEMIRTFHAALSRLAGLSIPTVALVHGAALGGGMELALACDFILAREGARLGQPEIRLGVFPPYAAAVLPRRIGLSATLDICLSGRTLRTDEALAMGLVQKVLPEASFDADAAAFIDVFAGLSPTVLRVTKRAVMESLTGTQAEALARTEDLYLNDLMTLSDAHEGLSAFLEKRTPVWKGS